VRQRLLAVAANTYRESVRERVLYNLVFFAMLMTLSGLLLNKLSLRQDEKIVKDLGLASIEVFGTMIAIFVGVGLVAKELERRSLYPLLAKPLSREEFVLGKFLGLGLTLLVNTAVMTLGLLATLLLTRGSFDPRLLEAVFAIYLGLLLVVALALLFSTLASPALAAVCTVSTVVAGRFSDVIHNMKDVIPDAPVLLIKLLYYALPNFRNFDLKDRVVYGDPVSAADLAWIGAYAAVYVALLLVATLVAFSRKELQ
jgi:ABC-type transport system involved in multi-copper enzyme maturation permease subunit